MPPSLADNLRTATWPLHRDVERAGVMNELLHGRLPLAGYVQLLRNLHALYAALEAGLAQHAGHPLLAPFDWPALRRENTLAADLQTLAGPGWEHFALQPAMQAYVARLQAITATAPEQLLAHAYVRYLGDLNGGQVLRRIVTLSLGLPPGSATAFYDFGPPERAATLAGAFREQLDALPLTEPQSSQIVDEAQYAFRQHERLFEELAAGR